jgi:ribosomal protein L39E
MVSKKAAARSSKKRHLQKAKSQTKWAPFWTVLKKFGKGKRIHPSAITHVRRSWRRHNLKIKPRKLKKNYLG